MRAGSAVGMVGAGDASQQCGHSPRLRVGLSESDDHHGTPRQSRRAPSDLRLHLQEPRHCDLLDRDANPVWGQFLHGYRHGRRNSRQGSGLHAGRRARYFEFRSRVRQFHFRLVPAPANRASSARKLGHAGARLQWRFHGRHLRGRRDLRAAASCHDEGLCVSRWRRRVPDRLRKQTAVLRWLRRHPQLHRVQMRHCDRLVHRSGNGVVTQYR